MTNENLNQQLNDEFNEELKELYESEQAEEKKEERRGLFAKRKKLENPLDYSENKKRKKYMAAIAVFAIILSVGVVGNWYVENNDLSSTIQPLLDSASEKTLGKAELVDATTTPPQDESSYFSSARVERRTARDQSMEKLQAIINSAEESEEAKQQANEKITAISSYINIENKIETLVCAKGVNNCLAVISEDGSRVDVIVDSETLDDTLIMQIKDIAVSQSGCSFENISIIQSTK